MPKSLSSRKYLPHQLKRVLLELVPIIKKNEGLGVNFTNNLRAAFAPLSLR